MALLLLILPGLYNGMCIQNYCLESEKITNPIRIALVSDLHSCKYGKNQQNLIEVIDGQNPDLVMLTGDIFDDQIPDANTEQFLAGIAETYPCYYVTGNHEYWSGADAFDKKMAILAKYHINRMSGTSEIISLNGETLQICGVDDPDAIQIDAPEGSFQEQLNLVKEQTQDEYYTILLSHRPELLEQYTDDQFDLVLSGHAHGGQWRIPGILNGLYAPDQGLFPQYAGGIYQSGDTTMVVSRGLARESTRIPRFYNRPELVIIDLL